MYGLIGYPLSHSFSKNFFTRKFADENLKGTEYQNFPLENIEAFRGLVDNHPNFQGLNVTIPYKEKIIPFLDALDPVASEIGAVNTIKFIGTGESRILKGFNTDAYGFTRSLQEVLGQKHSIQHALILGTGGASKAVAYALKQMNIPYEFVSSSSKTSLGYESLTRELIQNSKLIVNTTPLGMYPKILDCPAIPYDFISREHILFDLVYNPAISLFLQNGMEKGASISNGLKMLEYQALKAWEIWGSEESGEIGL